MIRSLLLLTCGAVFVFLTTGSGQAAMLTLDQSFDASNDYFSYVDNQSVVAQTLTVGQTGLLSQVDLQIHKASADTTGDPILTILGTSVGVPDSSNVLGSVSIPNSSISVDFGVSNGDFLSVDVSGLGISVIPGEVLALELTDPAGTGTYYWLDTSLFPGSTYPGGSEFTRYASSSTWLSEDPTDAGFQTWVAVTPAVPEPSTLMLLGIGCACLCGFGPKRKRRQVE